MTKEQKMKVIVLLSDLKRSGSFYISAIEIDTYLSNSSTGEDFERRIDNLLAELKK